MSRSRLTARSLTAAFMFAALSTSSTTITAAAAVPPSPVREVADATGAGGIVHYDLVLARDWEAYTIRFSRGSAEIIVDGDGSTDLDCRVYDSQGTLVASDTDYTDYCILRWRQWVSGPVRLEVVNLGYVSNYFEITTN
jgi:hypothetical protein